MKLFLLNFRETKKPRKIGLIFLGFFCNFLHISKAGQKKKKENVEQYWADFGPNRPNHRKPGRAHARAGGFTERPPMV
jgi:hypothetical protein